MKKKDVIYYNPNIALINFIQCIDVQCFDVFFD